MRFGIWAPRGGKSDEQDVGDEFRFAAEVIRSAEAHGFEVTLVAQRFLGVDLDAWVLASALASITESIELLVALHPGIITPQAVAKMGATLDRISHGRFAINLVNGWWQEEMEIFGNGAWLDRSDARYRRMDEFIQVVQGLWSEKVFSFDGEFFRMNAGQVPTQVIQKPFPPIYAASSSDAGKTIIAKRCQYKFIPYEIGFRRYEENFATIVREIEDMNTRCAAFERPTPMRYAISTNVICAETQAQAEAEADAIEAGGYDKKRGGTAIKALGTGLVGTPEFVAERIRRYEEAGVDCLMLRFPKMLSGIESFGRDIIPLVNAKPSLAQRPPLQIARG